MSSTAEIHDESAACSDEQEMFIEIEIQNDLTCGGTKMKNTDVERSTSYMYRHRLLHTICVCGSMLCLGWTFGLMGPTFPDLRLIMNEDLATASWILTGWAFGGLIGSIGGGIAYDRFNKIGVFVVVTAGLGIAVAMVPWCKHFVAMLVMHVLIGAFGGVIKTAATADCVVVWRSKARSFLQAAHGILCVGAIVSPFLSEPFLAKPVFTEHIRVDNSSFLNLNESYIYVTTYNGSQETSPNTQNINYIFSNNRSLHEAGINNGSVLYGETKIYVPYFISGGVCLLWASLFIIVTVLYGNVYTKSMVVEHDNENVVKKDYFLSKRWQNIFTLLLALTLTLYITCERGPTQFLMTFLISALKWDKTDGANASSTFWITYASGRLASIFILKKIKITTIFIIFFLIVTVGVSMLWIAAIFSITPLVFVSIAVMGFGMSPIFASLIAVESEKIRHITGKVSAVFFVFNNVGGMVSPLLLGFLMENVSNMWFIYLIMLLNGAILCSMIAIFSLYGYFARSVKKDQCETIVNN